MILLIDNYDSFTYNVYQAVTNLGYPTTVIRNDQTSCREIVEANYDAVIISPGPERRRMRGSAGNSSNPWPAAPDLGYLLGPSGDWRCLRRQSRPGPRTCSRQGGPDPSRWPRSICKHSPALCRRPLSLPDCGPSQPAFLSQHYRRYRRRIDHGIAAYPIRSGRNPISSRIRTDSGR